MSITRRTTEHEFAEDLGQLLTRGLIELDDAPDSDGFMDEHLRFRPTPAGLDAIAPPLGHDKYDDPRD
jgi:hypothetical protein